MKCNKCHIDLTEKEIHESHDVPCYLFIKHGNRKGQKNEADKHGRHWLCKKCHDEYEDILNALLKKTAKEFSMVYFKEVKNGDTNT